MPDVKMMSDRSSLRIASMRACASSTFDRFGAFEPEEGVYDTWAYDASGLPVTGPRSAQIKVP